MAPSAVLVPPSIKDRLPLNTELPALAFQKDPARLSLARTAYGPFKNHVNKARRLPSRPPFPARVLTFLPRARPSHATAASRPILQAEAAATTPQVTL